jgi:hypothetical protein
MEKSVREYAGRTFSEEDIETIIWTRKTFRQQSEKELACTICETLEWLTISGLPKYTACKGFLRQLAAEGIIDLPDSQGRYKAKTGGRERKAAERVNALPDRMEEITEVEDIQLDIAQAGPRLQLLRAYLQKYHKLGDAGAYGDKIYYFIIDQDGRELGCMRFSVASWALEERDKWIGWTAEQRKPRLFLIANQSRYLIFPWVRVKNLSSRVLSLAARRISGDWLERYCYEPVLLETFVDTAHFAGTSYKAANWTYVGQSKGRGRNDRYSTYALSLKDIYMYPLRRDFREVLKGEKPFKAVKPDE